MSEEEVQRIIDNIQLRLVAEKVGRIETRTKDEIILIKCIQYLQQENKQLKSILTELEEWLNRERNDDSEYSSYLRFTAFDETLDKIQELKEKYK